MVRNIKKIKFFKTERQAEEFLKRNRKNIKFPGHKPTIQGNTLVFIPRRRKSR